MLAGVTIVDPASAWIDVGRRRSRPTPSSTRSRCSGAGPTVAAGRRGRPARGRRRRRDRRRCARGPVLLPSPGNRSRGGGEGGHVRGDEEFAYRRAHEGAAPLLHRRRRHRRGHQHRRRKRHRELLARPGPAARERRRSARTSGPAWTIRSLLRSRLATTLGSASGTVVTDDVPPGSLAGFPPRQETKEGWVYERGESRRTMATTELARLPGLEAVTEHAHPAARPLDRARAAEAADGLLRALAPRPRAEHRREARRRARRNRARHVRERRDLLPLRRVDPRRRRLPRPDRLRAGGQEPDGAAGDDPGARSSRPRSGSPPSCRCSPTRARTGRRSRASRSPPASSPTCSSSPAPTAC